MKKNFTLKRYWFPLLLAFTLCAFTVGLYIYLTKDFPSRLNKEITLSGNLASQDFKVYVQHNINALENLKGRIEVSNGEYFKYWKNDAARIINQNPSLVSIKWINAQGLILDIIPDEDSSSLLSDTWDIYPNRTAEWERHIVDNTSNITSYYNRSSGRYLFLVDIPVIFNDQLQGSLTAEMDFTSHFLKMNDYLKDYALLLQDENGNILYSLNDPHPEEFSKQLVFKKKYIS